MGVNIPTDNYELTAKRDEAEKSIRNNNETDME